MGFWKSSRPQFITNQQQITASQQQKLLEEMKLDQSDIKKLKSKLQTTNQGRKIMNPNQRISLQQLKEILKKHDSKLADKVNSAYAAYQKKSQEYLQKFCEEQAEMAKLKENIKRTQGFDIKRERGKEYLAQIQNKANKKSASAFTNPSTAAETSAGRWNVSERKTTAADRSEKTGKKQSVSDFNQLKQKSQNLPDLPI